MHRNPRVNVWGSCNPNDMNIVGAQIQQVSWHAIFSSWKGLVRTLITRVFIPLAQTKGEKPKGQQTQCKMRSEANAKSQKPKAKKPRAKWSQSQKPEAKRQKPSEAKWSQSEAKWSQVKPSEAKWSQVKQITWKNCSRLKNKKQINKYIPVKLPTKSWTRTSYRTADIARMWSCVRLFGLLDWQLGTADKQGSHLLVLLITGK